ncbi:MAG: gluconate transporter [Gemmatimonadota bacterium]|nr:MAG: gluconate transporter [Gemmatimonadota bacterium]
MSTGALVGLVVFGIALLLVLVVVTRLHAFIALLVTSLVVAVLGGIPLAEIAGLIQQEMGGTLGYIAVVIGVGAMFGEMLQQSGGARSIAHTLLRVFGDRFSPWALGLAGLIVAVPVFFDVALILFIPLVYSLARRSGRSLLYYAIPLLAGIAVAHSFIPPTPGPVAVAGLRGADLGWVISLGVIAGIPATIVGGIWFGRRVCSRIHLEVPDFMHLPPETTNLRAAARVPGFALAAGLIALPLVLILLGTVSSVALPDGHRMRGFLAFVGHPFTALITATLLSFYLLGTRLGFSRDEVRRMATKSLEPVCIIILVTGAGGVFGKVLLATGVGTAVADWMATSRLPLVALAFLIAAVVRVAQGSATVSMVTAAGLMAPIIEATTESELLVAAIVIAIASGATVLSHVNDSGFWLVSRYLGMSEKQTLRVWTVMETLVGLTGFGVVLLLSFFL